MFALNENAEIFRLCDKIRETSFAIHKYHKHGHLEKVYEQDFLKFEKRHCRSAGILPALERPGRSPKV